MRGRCIDCGSSRYLTRGGLVRSHQRNVGIEGTLRRQLIRCSGSLQFPLDETHRYCNGDFHRCADGGGPGLAAQYEDQR